ncbi:MAG: ATP-binding protein [Acidobacteriota bacterium]
MNSRFLWKLFAGYAFLILLATGLVGGLVGRSISSATLSETDVRLQSVAVLSRALAVDALESGGSADELGSLLRSVGASLDARITLFDADGAPFVDSQLEAVAPTAGPRTQRPEVTGALASERTVVTRWSASEGRRLRFLALPLEVDGRRAGVVRVSLPLDALDARLDELKEALFVGTSVAILVALGLGYLYARRVTRPLLEMADAATDIAAGAFDRRVESASNDELGRLARAFNSMSRELRSSVEAMLSDRNKLSAILASMVEGVVAVDRDERVVHMNAVAGRLLKVDPRRVSSHPIWEITRIHEVSQVLSESMERRALVEREIRLAGSPDRILRLASSPLETEQGLSGAVLMLDDVTQLRHLETMRRDFVANVSHELKTPITAIRGLAETLIDDPDVDGETRGRFLGRVLVQVERMADLVNDLLSLARFESGASDLEPSPMDLRLPVRLSVRGLTTASETKGVQLHIDLPAEPVLVDGEEEALRQAVSNLLDNAIKYAPAHSAVEVRVLRDATHAMVEVEDHGPGIEPVHQARLFERFYRVDKARSRELGGTGLGLAIVKHIALAFGGEVSVDSQPGRGSIFRIRMPLAVEEPTGAVAHVG